MRVSFPNPKDPKFINIVIEVKTLLKTKRFNENFT